MRVVRAFCKEDAENAKFERKNQLLTRMQLTVGRISAMMNPVTYVVINAAVILLIQTGAMRVQMGDLSQGQVVALYNYMSQILVELIKMANLIITLTKAAACPATAYRACFPSNRRRRTVSSSPPQTHRMEASYLTTYP